ncbi:MAG: hypothetical protein KAI47_18655 [Deltaproteobacteria bacterium]|nr:hypothetical protein [Deltaproteobacteria bacterium]
MEHKPIEKDLGGQRLDYGPPRFDIDSPLPDVATPDSMAPVLDVNPGLCSPAGTPKACDPVTSTGCSAGSCYLLKTIDLACVCPKGTKAAGELCMTTTDCAPGYGCAGTVAPGSCRRYCRPGGINCMATETCKAVNSFPTVGMCIPNN